MKKKIKYIILLCVTVLIYSKTQGQTISEDFDILKPITPKIKSPKKIQFQPITPTYTNSKPKLQYEIYDSKIDSFIVNDNNKLNASMISSRSKYIPLLYVKLGAGNMKSYLGDLSFNSFPSKNLEYAFNIRHRSIKGSSVNDQIINTNKIFGLFNITNPTNVLKLNLNYDQSSFYFYGINQPISLGETTKKATDKHGINHLNASLSVSNRDNKNISYAANMQLYNLRTNRSVTENSININSNILLDTYLGFTTKLNINFLKLQKNSNPNHIFSILPHLLLNVNNIYMKVGANATILVNRKTMLRLYPYIYTKFNIIPEYLNIFAELSGNTEPITYKNLLIINPYIDNSIDVLNTNKKLNLKLGLNFSPNGLVQFKTALGYHMINNLPLFVNKEGEIDKFQVLYSDSVRALILDTELQIRYNDKIHSNLEVLISDYKLNNDLQATYLPKFKASFINTIKLVKNLNLSARLDYISAQSAYIEAPLLKQLESVKAHLTVSLGAQYDINNISIFANVNNLFNNKYEIFKFYPGFGTNLLAGLSIRI